MPSERTGRSRARSLAAALATLALVATGTIASVVPAHAADYPSWSDVLEARKNETRAKSEVARITGLISSLEDEVERTEAIAIEKGNILYEAELDRDEAAEKARELQAQADAAHDLAEDSRLTAAQLAAGLARANGSSDPSVLFFRGDQASNLLSQIGLASKLGEQSQSVFDKATRDRNEAQALTDQANVQRAEYERLAAIAEEAFVEAQTAAIAAADALREQQERIATLRAQLATLTSDRIHTEEEYLEGIRAKWGPGASGEVSAHGWARPSGGYVTSHYGWRLHPIWGNWRLHAGTDLGAACNSPIFAAHGGTVTYAGWNGGYGYQVRIQHPGNVMTSYAHIVSGGIMVSIGQLVGPGQQIARVGTTGDSTGCHLHFEVHTGGGPINPVPYLRDRGISLT